MLRLLVVYPRAFVSGWGADTPRLMQMARGLGRSSWSVELLRCRHPHDRNFQSMVEAFPGRVVTVPFYGPFSRFTNRKGLRRGLRFWWRLSNKSELDDYPEVVARRMVRFAGKTAIERPDVVFAYTGGQLESFVSGHQLSTYFGCPLVLEFRDPIPHPGNPPLNSRQRELLRLSLSQAALVIGTTKGICTELVKEYAFLDSKVRTIYSSYDDEVPVPPTLNLATDKLVLAHAGVLYGGSGRNARSLVKAIASAAATETSVQNRVQLRLIGAGKGGVEAFELAKELNVPWAVEVVPQLAHRDCLKELDKAHMLVVIKFDDPHFDLQIPGKLFQYLGRGKPILGIMRETEAASILRRSGMGAVFDHSNISGLSAAILDYWKDRSDLCAKFRPDWDYIRSFSLLEMQNQFDRELSALLPKPTPPSIRGGELCDAIDYRSRQNPNSRC